MESSGLYEMRNYSLSIYRIAVNRRFDRETSVPLCDFDKGKDLLFLVEDMFSQWKRIGYRTTPTPVTALSREDEKETLRVSRIRQLPAGEFELHRTGRYLSGIIESGEYGTEESIIDYDTGQLKYRKEKGDAAMVPFYFMFNIPENSEFGYMILERIGNVGIQTVLSKSIREMLMRMVGFGYVAHIEPLMIGRVFDYNLSVVADAKKIILKDISKVPDGFVEMTKNLSEDVRGDIVFSAGRNRRLKIRPLFDDLMNKKKAGKPYTFHDIECADVSFELKIGDKTKTVSIGRLSSLGTNMDVTSAVTIGTDGYPTFESLNREAQELMSFVRNEKRE